MAARPRRSKSHSPNPDAGSIIMPMPLGCASSPTSPTQSAYLHDMTNLRKSASSASFEGGGGGHSSSAHRHARVVNTWNQRVPACRMQ